MSIFKQSLFYKSSSLAMYDFLDGMNNNRSSIIAPQYFLLCKHSKIVLIYDYQIDGDIFNPMDIL